MEHSVSRFLWAICPEAYEELSFVTRLDYSCSGLLLAGVGLLGCLLQGQLMFEYHVLRCYVVAGASEGAGIPLQMQQVVRNYYQKH